MKNITKISLALLSGLLVAAAWPTKGFALLIFVAFVPLIYLQDVIGSKDNNIKGNIFWISFLAFFVWNALTTWWVWNSTPAGSVAMLLLNSSFMATTFWLYHFTRKNVFGNKNGFFLMIEGSQIDWGSHANDASHTIAEVIDFDKTIGVVLDYAEKQGNTLVIITADHETGGVTIKEGDIKKGEVEIRFESIKHSGTLVPVFSFGPKAEIFNGFQENIDIPKKIMTVWNLEK